MKMKPIVLLPFIAILTFYVESGNADGVVYDNGLPDLSDALFSDFDVDHVFGGKQGADDFVLTQPANVTGLNFFGAYGFSNIAPTNDAFTIRVFNDESGTPASDPFFEQFVGNVSRNLTGDDILVFDVYEYQTNLPTLSLQANTTYWLSVVNDTTGDEYNNNWAWATSATTGNSQERFFDDGTWELSVLQFPGSALAFSLHGNVVPEPSSTALLGVCLIGGFLRRRSK